MWYLPWDTRERRRAAAGRLARVAKSPPTPPSNHCSSPLGSIKSAGTRECQSAFPPLIERAASSACWLRMLLWGWGGYRRVGSFLLLAAAWESQRGFKKHRAPGGSKQQRPNKQMARAARRPQGGRMAAEPWDRSSGLDWIWPASRQDPVGTRCGRRRGRPRQEEQGTLGAAVWLLWINQSKRGCMEHGTERLLGVGLLVAAAPALPASRRSIRGSRSCGEGPACRAASNPARPIKSVNQSTAADPLLRINYTHMDTQTPPPVP